MRKKDINKDLDNENLSQSYKDVDYSTENDEVNKQKNKKVIPLVIGGVLVAFIVFAGATFFVLKPQIDNLNKKMAPDNLITAINNNEELEEPLTEDINDEISISENTAEKETGSNIKVTASSFMVGIVPEEEQDIDSAISDEDLKYVAIYRGKEFSISEYMKKKGDVDLISTSAFDIFGLTETKISEEEDELIEEVETESIETEAENETEEEITNGTIPNPNKTYFDDGTKFLADESAYTYCYKKDKTDDILKINYYSSTFKVLNNRKAVKDGLFELTEIGKQKYVPIDIFFDMLNVSFTESVNDEQGAHIYVLTDNGGYDIEKDSVSENKLEKDKKAEDDKKKKEESKTPEKDKTSTGSKTQQTGSKTDKGSSAGTDTKTDTKKTDPSPEIPVKQATTTNTTTTSSGVTVSTSEGSKDTSTSEGSSHKGTSSDGTASGNNSTTSSSTSGGSSSSGSGSGSTGSGSSGGTQTPEIQNPTIGTDAYGRPSGQYYGCTMYGTNEYLDPKTVPVTDMNSSSDLNNLADILKVANCSLTWDGSSILYKSGNRNSIKLTRDANNGQWVLSLYCLLNKDATKDTIEAQKASIANEIFNMMMFKISPDGQYLASIIYEDYEGSEFINQGEYTRVGSVDIMSSIKDGYVNYYIKAVE